MAECDRISEHGTDCSSIDRRLRLELSLHAISFVIAKCPWQRFHSAPASDGHPGTMLDLGSRRSRTHAADMCGCLTNIKESRLSDYKRHHCNCSVAARISFRPLVNPATLLIVIFI